MFVKGNNPGSKLLPERISSCNFLPELMCFQVSRTTVKWCRDNSFEFKSRVKLEIWSRESMVTQRWWNIHSDTQFWIRIFINPLIIFSIILNPPYSCQKAIIFCLMYTSNFANLRLHWMRCMLWCKKIIILWPHYAGWTAACMRLNIYISGGTHRALGLKPSQYLAP